ncbi:MAG: hypothetical protein ACR2G7_09895 [Acidimicrobiales bacterium]
MPEEGGGEAGGLRGRDELLSGRTRRRAPHLLFLLESWSDLADDDVFDFLESTQAFAGMSRDELRGLLPYLEPVHVAAGEVVIRQGQAAAGHGACSPTSRLPLRSRLCATRCYCDCRVLA